MNAVDPAYLNSDKAAFMMNWTTLLSLWKLRGANGRLVFPPDFDDDGTPVLVGFPVGIAPSLPNVGASAVPIYFGDFAYFLTRVVLPQAAISIDRESRAEWGQTVFRAMLRAQGTVLLSAASTTHPIAGLKNAASVTGATAAKHSKHVA
jgi:HK97 family phage major capsid protein